MIAFEYWWILILTKWNISLEIIVLGGGGCKLNVIRLKFGVCSAAESIPINSIHIHSLRHECFHIKWLFMWYVLQLIVYVENDGKLFPFIQNRKVKQLRFQVAICFYVCFMKFSLIDSVAVALWFCIKCATVVVKTRRKRKKKQVNEWQNRNRVSERTRPTVQSIFRWLNWTV